MLWASPSGRPDLGGREEDDNRAISQVWICRYKWDRFYAGKGSYRGGAGTDSGAGEGSDRGSAGTGSGAGKGSDRGSAGTGTGAGTGACTGTDAGTGNVRVEIQLQG